MLETIKGKLKAGMNAVAMTKEKAEKVLHEYVEKGKISRKDAKEMVSKLAESSKKEYKKASSDVSETYNEVVKKMGLVNKKQVESLEKRIAGLEKELKKKKTRPPVKKQATKRAPKS